MIESSPETDQFKQDMRISLERETRNCIEIRVARHDNVYAAGSELESVYFIESGKIKLIMLSPEGRECMLAIHSSGDIFGELCLSGLRGRQERLPLWKIHL